MEQVDLGHRTADVAFEAQWYCRTPNLHASGKKSTKARVETVTNQTVLDRWAAAWGESTEIFKPALLLDDAVALIYVEKDGEIISGLATNLSGDSVGISNAFGQPDGILGCIDAISTKHPTKGIVGYGGKAEVAALSSVGFQAIGDLQIWLRN